jgi:diadenosine tetraphosphate (Ap4A) HIT family hydrolase
MNEKKKIEENTIETTPMFPIYNPPVKLLEKSAKDLIPWSKLLSIYKKDPETNKDWIYCIIKNESSENLEENSEDTAAIVIYDRYPKASYHLLLLPMVPFSNRPEEFTKKDLDIIRKFHQIARLIVESLKKNTDLNFLIGYHARPSMEDLHIHIISDDIKKNHDSFMNPKNFFSIDIIEKELEITEDLRNLY